MGCCMASRAKSLYTLCGWSDTNRPTCGEVYEGVRRTNTMPYSCDAPTQVNLLYTSSMMQPMNRWTFTSSSFTFQKYIFSDGSTNGRLFCACLVFEEQPVSCDWHSHDSNKNHQSRHYCSECIHCHLHSIRPASPTLCYTAASCRLIQWATSEDFIAAVAAFITGQTNARNLMTA